MNQRDKLLNETNREAVAVALAKFREQRDALDAEMLRIEAEFDAAMHAALGVPDDRTVRRQVGGGKTRTCQIRAYRDGSGRRPDVDDLPVAVLYGHIASCEPLHALYRP